MLGKRTLEETIAIVGPQALGHWEFMKVCDQYKIEVGSKWMMDLYGGHSLGGLFRKDRAHVLSQAEAGNINYSHAVLLYRGNLYDPYHGIDPAYSWRHWFYAAMEILDAPLYY
jgi:hypothetical protein